MKKVLLSVAVAGMLVMALIAPQTLKAQVYGEFSSIELVENTPYEYLQNGNVITYFALPPTYNVLDKDDGYAKVDIGFPFEFNGEVYTQAWVSTNGFITFTEPPYLPARDPNALFLDANNYPTNVIAPYWGDHYYRDETDFFTNGFMPTQISYATQQVDANQKVFIVEWKNLNINYKLNGQVIKSSVGTFQLRIYESTDAYSKQGDIEFAYDIIGNNPYVEDNTVVTKGAVVGLKGEGKIVGEGADFLNGLMYNRPIEDAAVRHDTTSFWQPSGGTDKRIRFYALERFNVAEWWGDGDVDFSKAEGRKHYGMPQNRFVTANDARLIMKSVATGVPLDPVRRREAYHGDVNHNGRYYYNSLNEKVNITTKSSVFTDDLPNEVSSIKQILFEVTEMDASLIMNYLAAKVPELPWLIDSIPYYGKLSSDVIANNIKIGTPVSLGNGEYNVPVYLNGNVKSTFGTKFELNGTVLDVTTPQFENSNIMNSFYGSRVVLSGSGSFDSETPVAFVKLRTNNSVITANAIRFDDVNMPSVSSTVNEGLNASFSVVAQPNPATTVASINVNVPQNGVYTVSVYNMIGSRMATIYSGELNAGSKTFIWDLTGNQGDKLNAGVYFVKLESNNSSTVCKVVVE